MDLGSTADPPPGSDFTDQKNFKGSDWMLAPLRFRSNMNNINKTILSSSGSQTGTNISSRPKMMYVHLMISDFNSILFLFLSKLMIFKNAKSHYRFDSAFSSRRR